MIRTCLVWRDERANVCKQYNQHLYHGWFIIDDLCWSNLVGWNQCFWWIFCDRQVRGGACGLCSLLLNSEVMGPDISAFIAVAVHMPLLSNNGNVCRSIWGTSDVPEQHEKIGTQRGLHVFRIHSFSVRWGSLFSSTGNVSWLTRDPQSSLHRYRHMVSCCFTLNTSIWHSETTLKSSIGPPRRTLRMMITTNLPTFWSQDQISRYEVELSPFLGLKRTKASDRRRGTFWLVPIQTSC